MALKLGSLMNVFDEDEAIALLRCLEENDIFEEEYENQNLKTSSLLIEGCLLRSLYQIEKRRADGVLKEMDEKDEAAFFRECRIGRDLFYSLVERLSNHSFYARSQTGGGRKPLGVETSILMALWYLQQRRYIEITQAFSVSMSSSHKHINFFFDSLTEMAPEVIVWPSPQEADKIVEEFSSIAGFPGVIGVIGSWRIKIRAPSENVKAYIDEEGNHSVNVIVVCDSRKKLTYTNIGFEGSAQNQRVFANSELGKRLDEDPLSCCYNPNYHLVGDKSFALKEYLIVPFKETSNYDPKKRQFNKRLLETWRVVEDTFDWMKIRFNKMDFIEADIQRVSKTITAMCVLHNLSMNSEQDTKLLKYEVDMFRLMQSINAEENGGSHMKCAPFENYSESSAGVQKRNSILKIF